jgi:hypothetical protein
LQGDPQEIIKSQNVKDLEEAYLKIMGAKHMEDLLSWRENGQKGEAPKKKEKKKRK